MDVPATGRDRRAVRRKRRIAKIAAGDVVSLGRQNLPVEAPEYVATVVAAGDDQLAVRGERAGVDVRIVVITGDPLQRVIVFGAAGERGRRPGRRLCSVTSTAVGPALCAAPDAAG